jgi:excinuclease ABC subunit C
MTDDEPEGELAYSTAEDEAIPAFVSRGAMLIREIARTAPKSPGVYRMFSDKGEVLYVGKAKHIQRRILSYTRLNGLVLRIQRMVSQTVRMEFITTGTETEALLLEANLIKQLKPRFNVLLRDDKSFPYILITGGHASPQLTKHRGGRTIKGDYFGPFADANSVNRAMHALQRAFMLRSCTDSDFETRSRPCLLHQIKRCAGPCTNEVTPDYYMTLVKETKMFLSGRSQTIKRDIADKMEKASEALEFEQAAILRDRLGALSSVQGSQGVNPQSFDEADLFAVYQAEGHTCIQVFFFRTGQNWGNRAYYPRADKTLEAGEILGPFLAQFYADKPVPSLILTSHESPDQTLLSNALSQRNERKVVIATPERGEKHDIMLQAIKNAKEALERKLTETATQKTLLVSLAKAFDLPKIPMRIEILDNSHISGTSSVGAMVVAGIQGFMKNAYRKFNIKDDAVKADDLGMMREVLTRRFRKDREKKSEDDEFFQMPDLIIIDGGMNQLNAAHEVLKELAPDIPLISIAKGRDREAGREEFHRIGHPPVRLEPRDPLLFFIQRLRDEAHRYAIGAHRTLRAKSMREGGLEEIPGIGKTRKRALVRHFGTVKAIERASFADLQLAPGINNAMATAIYAFFHPDNP